MHYNGYTMKILITGGTGFQGSHLAEMFATKGHEVTVLNTFSHDKLPNITNFNSSSFAHPVNVVYGSVTDKVLVDKTVRKHEVVFHLAGNINVDESLYNPRGYVDSNIVGTLNILEAVREKGARMVYASTCEVYGDGHDVAENALLDETAEMRPNSPYASSKAGADRLCHSYFKSFDVNVTVVRPFNIFGPRQKSGEYGAVIPIFVRKAMAGEPLTIFGDGEATRDYMYISDLVKAYEIVLESDALGGRAVNFASGVNTSIKDIAQYIAKKFDAEVKHGPARPGEVKRFPADISLAKSLGFEPKVDIWEGIDLYIDWAKDHNK